MGFNSVFKGLNDLEKEEKALRITADQADRHYHKLIEWGI
jgi:hypothetical protein